MFDHFVRLGLKGLISLLTLNFVLNAFKMSQKDTKTTPAGILCVSLLLTLNAFSTTFGTLVYYFYLCP